MSIWYFLSVVKLLMKPSMRILVEDMASLCVINPISGY